MNIKFKIGKFLEALDIVYLTVDKSGNLDTKDVLVSASSSNGNQRIYLYSTNFVNQSVTKLEAEVTEDGNFPFNPNELYSALANRNPEDTATIVVTEKDQVIKIGKSRFKLSSSRNQGLVTRLKDIPFSDPTTFSISPDDLIECFKRVRVCVSQDTNNTNRAMMRCVHIKNSDKAYVVETTDGYSAASIVVNQKETPSQIDFLIPGEFSNILLSLCARAKKAGETSINVIKNTSVYFKAGNSLISTGVVTGKFPDVTGVIKAQTPLDKITVDLTVLKTTINRILGFDKSGLGNVVLQVIDQTLTVRSLEAADCEEFIEVEIDGTAVPETFMKLSGRRLLEITGTVSGAKVVIGIPARPINPISVEESIEGKLDARYVMMAQR